MEAVIKKKLSFRPRDYQLYYLEKAKEQNVIICLGTGSGKTYITIMLLMEYGKKIKKEKMKAIFLAPTVPLVNQQGDEIIRHTNFETKVIYGDLGVDCWDENKWKDVIESNDVLVLIPDLFHTILTKQIIDIEQICVLIFDEAHHAGLKKKNGSCTLEDTKHAYKRIMNYITEKKMHNRIRIIGTTASVVNGCFDPLMLLDCFKNIEITFNARILGEFEFDPRFLAEPKIMIWMYSEKIKINEKYAELYSVINKLDRIIRSKEREEQEDYFNTMLNVHSSNYYLLEKPLIKPSYIKRMIRDIQDVHQELGVYPAYLVCLEFKKEMHLIKNLISNENLCFLINLCINFLTFCEKMYLKTINKLKVIGKDNAMLNLVTSKLLRLLDIFHLYHEIGHEFSSLVFVERVLFSFAISKFLECLSENERFSYIKSSFFVGNNNEYLNFKFIKQSVKNFKDTIKKFKDGNLNLLITTAVLEEGIDIGKCNLVIRFSEAKTYREFVQSKGRGRAKNAVFIILTDDMFKLNNQLKIFSKTEEFLNHRFKLSKELKFNEMILPDEFQIINDEEFIESETGAKMSLHEASPFLNRYIIKKGNNNFSPTYSFDEIEFGFRAKLNLSGVTPLKNEIFGKIHTDKYDAFRSACLKACEELYKMGQLDHHFIPISEDQVVKKCNLINRNYNEQEAAELNLIFNAKKQRFVFKKNMNSFSYFKKFIKLSDCNNLYEIDFDSEDKYLNQGNDKLALITPLDLNEFEGCLSTTVYSSLYTAKINLKLIKSDLKLDQNQLDEIGQFTVAIFKNSIPILKKRPDLKFNLEKFIFKFAFINPKNGSIDYDQMDKIVNLNVNHLDENLLEGENNLVRAIHTNTDYKLVSTSTKIFPNDTFFLKNQNKYVTYNEYFKQTYDRVITNQRDELIQVEKADLISCYSIYVKPEEKSIEEDKTSDFKIYLPKEFCVISSITKSLYKKSTCLAPLIYRIKQKIILEDMCINLNSDILHVDKKDAKSSIFDSDQNSNNIDEYIYEIFNKKKFMPLFENSESSSSDEESDQKEFVEEDKVIQKLDQQMNKEIAKTSKKNKEEIIVDGEEYVIHPSITQQTLDELLFGSMEKTLREEHYSNIQDYSQRFVEQFENFIKPSSNKDLKKFCDIEPKLKKRKMDESKELKKINFNHWIKKDSDKQIISQTTLLEALTAKSAIDAINLERLEFLGDTYLKFMTCNILFHLYPDSPVGELDILKNRTVSNKNLYGISKRKRLLEFIFADNFLPGVNWMPDGFEYTKPDPNSSDKLVTIIAENVFERVKMSSINRNHYQELKPKTISDAIESLIGGVLVSSGMRNASLLMKYLGIYSEQYKLDVSYDQKSWFIGDGEKYDPLKNDSSGSLSALIKRIYANYDFESLEEKIDYKFQNQSLLIQAFKHASFTGFNEIPSYENLEFLGDSVIDLLIAQYFYDAKENFSPGQLTNLKQALINNQFFGSLTIKFELYKWLIFQSPSLFNMIDNYKCYYNDTILPRGEKALNIPNSYLILDEPESINFDDSIEIHKVLGDIFESLIGAIFIDSEFCLNTVWSVLHKFMINELIEFRRKPPKTFISQLHELFPKNKFGDARVENKMTLIDFEIDGIVFNGCGLNKKLAKMDCAKKAIKYYISNVQNSVQVC